jgi:putative glutamine amidotransferase
MHRPRIGIPLGLDDRGRWRPERSYLYIDRSYADAIDRAGGLPLHLPIQSDAGSLLRDLDGLLLPGGDDLAPDPARDEGPTQIDGLDLDLVPNDQLAFDKALLAAALRERCPVLGICYGMQLLAREGGGRLLIHLPSQRPDAAPHKLASNADRHPIEIEQGSRLAHVLGATRCEVNSLHHQAVAEVGARHRVVARCPDGVVEAIEAKPETAGFEIGVQWHPEKLDAPESEALFEAFVAACRERAQNRRDR